MLFDLTNDKSDSVFGIAQYFVIHHVRLIHAHILYVFLQMMAQSFDSPSPSRIRRSPDSPLLDTSPYLGESPLEAPSADMPMGSKKGNQVDELYDFFPSAFSAEFLDQAETSKGMFEYKFDPNHPHKRDQNALKKYADIMQTHLREDPFGLPLKSDVEPAFQRLQSFTNRVLSNDKLSIRLQAANYCRLFSDLRSIRRDSTTQTRLPPHVKTMLGLLEEPSDKTTITLICNS